MYNISDDVNVEAIFAQADAQQAQRDAMAEAQDEEEFDESDPDAWVDTQFNKFMEQRNQNMRAFVVKQLIEAGYL